MKNINLLIVLCLCACNTNKEKVEPVDNFTDSISLEPCATIFLQPYEDFSQKEVEIVGNKVLKKLNKLYYGYWSIKVLPSRPLPIKAYYKPRHRYLANVLLKDLPNRSSPIYIIGLTHKDISFKIHNTSNYGIMGLTPLGKNKSIVSDFRAKGDDFVAVIVHEFGHGFFGLRHCLDTNCIMCDYQKHKGKPFSFNLCKEHEGIR